MKKKSFLLNYRDTSWIINCTQEATRCLAYSPDWLYSALAMFRSLPWPSLLEVSRAIFQGTAFSGENMSFQC